jgi:phage terminase small subunit
MNKQSLDKCERKFVDGVVKGKSLTQAAKDAGYAKSTAEKKASAILRRPLVQSELTKALEACGVKFKDVMQPILVQQVLVKCESGPTMDP